MTRTPKTKPKKTQQTPMQMKLETLCSTEINIKCNEILFVVLNSF